MELYPETSWYPQAKTFVCISQTRDRQRTKRKSNKTLKRKSKPQRKKSEQNKETEGKK